MTRRASLLLLVFLSLASIAYASDVAGNSIFIPVVSRTPGAFGSEWRTDLVISNASPAAAEVPFTITFTPNDGSPGTYATGGIAGRTSYTYPDVVNIVFGRAVAVGVVHVTSADPNARLTARARIYNIGSENGEFGQHVPGSRVEDLPRQHHLAGLSGVLGNRTNLGVANPWDMETSFWMNVFDGEGKLRFTNGLTPVTLEPRQVLQINDLFAWIGAEPFHNATVEIATSRPAFVYASVVRNDSGDPIFIPAVGDPGETSPGIVQPQCAGPAPLFLASPPADGWIVKLQPEATPATTAAALAAKHRFTVSSVFEAALWGFSSLDATADAVALLRCEPTVHTIWQNGYATGGSAGAD